MSGSGVYWNPDYQERPEAREEYDPDWPWSPDAVPDRIAIPRDPLAGCRGMLLGVLLGVALLLLGLILAGVI